MKPDDLYQDALDAINRCFDDRKASTAKRRERLENLAGEIEIMLDVLKAETKGGPSC